MNKIILHFGLLVFFLSIIFFSQRGMMLQDVILKSFVIFIVLTVILNVVAIIFIRSVNKTATEKNKKFQET
jgi:hypothetical protein